MSATAARRPRSVLAAQVAELAREGLWAREIADRLGISTSYAAELRDDPTGAKARARKERYRLPCPKCETLMYGGDGIKGAPTQCAGCAAAANHEERYWTRERIIERFRRFAEIAGRPPTTTDCRAQSGGEVPSLTRDSPFPLTPERVDEARRLTAQIRLPHPTFVYREIGSWADALEAAGLPAAPVGGRARRRRSSTTERVLAYLQENGESRPSVIARDTGVCLRVVRWAIARLLERGIAAVRTDPRDGRVRLVRLIESERSAA